ncbi:MAG: PQQ-binding-like beta-propeller repeat protein [Pirellulales bacterium]|jgi:outer membrane protein assembly factor BamB
MNSKIYAMGRFLFIAVFVILIAGAGDAQSEQPWPSFQGPHGSGATTEKIPQSLSEENIVWEKELPGRGLSTPVIHSDKVFLTCSSGPEQNRLRVLCLDATDGQLLWERQFWATGRTVCHEKTSVAAPTPCTDGKRIYAIFSSNDLVCLDFEGNLIWLRGITADYPNVSNSLGMSSSLVVTNGVVVAQVENDSESYVIGIDATTGINAWKMRREKAANWTSPLVLNPGVVELQSKSGIDAINVSNGNVLWRYDAGASTIPSSCRMGNILFVPSKGLTALAYDPKGQKQPEQLWQSSRLSPGTPSPVVNGETVFTISRGDVLTAGNVESGERRWQLRLKGPFSATPVISGNTLLAVSETGLVQAIHFDDEQGEVTGSLNLEDQVLASPAIASGGVFLRSNSRLWKLADVNQ